MATKIEWTDETWNPVRARHRVTGRVGWHCEKISPACAHCYAARFNKQGRGQFGTREDYTAAADVDVFLDERVLEVPLHWRRPRRIFVCSMTDLFGDWVSVEMLDRIYDVMAHCRQHTFQVLTKRPARLRRYHENLAKRVAEIPDNPVRFPLPNLWAGVTVESQDQTDRLEELLETPAAVRFVSAEPLVGELDLGLRNWRSIERDGCRLDWVIVGGESGRGKKIRPLHPDWVRLIRDDCLAGGVAFFFKQWGEFVPVVDEQKGGRWDGAGISETGPGTPEIPDRAGGYTGWEFPDGQVCMRVGKKYAGRLLDGLEWSEFPGPVLSRGRLVGRDLRVEYPEAGR